MKYKCIIVEDHTLQRDALEMDLLKTGLLEVVATCSNGLEAVKAMKEIEPDIVFSDIDMPGLSGLELLRSLKHPPVFVFITSHPEYAVESFDLDVVDFVMKPASFDRILKAVNKAIEYLDLKKLAEQKKSRGFTKLSSGNKLKDEDDHFFIRENYSLVKLKFKDVVYIESMGHFSQIFTLADQKHITLVGLKQLEQTLPSSVFKRVHRQYMVNHMHINTIDEGELMVARKYTIPIGLSYKQTLLDEVVGNKTITRFNEEK